MKKLLVPLVALREIVRVDGWTEALRETWLMLRMVIPALVLKSRRTSSREQDLRTHACNACVLHDPEYDSCGTPGRVVGGVRMGCWCSRPMIVLVKAKGCWRKRFGEDQWNFPSEHGKE